MRRSEVVDFCVAPGELTGPFHIWPIALQFQMVWVVPFILPNSSNNRNFTDCNRVMVCAFCDLQVHKHTIQYPNIPSAVKSVPRYESFPVLVTPKIYTLHPETDLKDSEPQPEPSRSTDDDEKYPADKIHRQPHLATQPELNDLFRDLEFDRRVNLNFLNLDYRSEMKKRQKIGPDNQL
ncbi:uncharacterized protein TNIN_417371 [Trichonephila inaurata madagascariensis]|uniref:Uncharacterized protein n=1 Tax=Trichonephila inaurata madagascariensis TaxID=2747483 RepID=A0A8X6XAP8_9ARAC|nr:uncharacterized protein TNIN_417371 [Trichonephila inaurata madagascariensis]